MQVYAYDCIENCLDLIFSSEYIAISKIYIEFLKILKCISFNDLKYIRWMNWCVIFMGITAMNIIQLVVNWIA